MSWTAELRCSSVPRNSILNRIVFLIPHSNSNFRNDFNAKKRCVHFFKSCVILKPSSFNGRPCARWLGRKEATLVVGRNLVTLVELGGLTRAVISSTEMLGRQRKKASSRGTFRSDKLAGLNDGTARKHNFISSSAGA